MIRMLLGTYLQAAGRKTIIVAGTGQIPNGALGIPYEFISYGGAGHPMF